MGIVAQFAAIAGPVTLGMMGVAVTVWPPSKPKHHWMWGAAFMLIGAVTVLGSIKQQHDAATAADEQTKTLDGLKQAIENLTKPVQPQSLATPLKDPDAIYQTGGKVGQIVAAREALNQSKIYFEMIKNASDLDETKPFEYRSYVLKMITARAKIGMLVTPQGVDQSVYRDVVCEIVGRTSK